MECAAPPARKQAQPIRSVAGSRAGSRAGKRVRATQASKLRARRRDGCTLFDLSEGRLRPADARPARRPPASGGLQAGATARFPPEGRTPQQAGAGLAPAGHAVTARRARFRTGHVRGGGRVSATPTAALLRARARWRLGRPHFQSRGGWGGHTSNRSASPWSRRRRDSPARRSCGDRLGLVRQVSGRLGLVNSPPARGCLNFGIFKRLQRIQTPESLFWDLGADKTFVTCWSGCRVQA